MNINWFLLLLLGIISKISEFFTKVRCFITGHKWVQFIGKQVICARCGKIKKELKK